MSEQKYLKIGEIAKKADVTIRTVRYYHELGLIKPVERTSANYRLYSESAITAIKLIKNLKELGFSLEKINELFLSLNSDEDDAISTLISTKKILRTEKVKINEKMVHYQKLSADIDFSLSVIDHCFECRKERGKNAPCKPDCENSSFHIRI